MASISVFWCQISSSSVARASDWCSENSLMVFREHQSESCLDLYTVVWKTSFDDFHIDHPPLPPVFPSLSSSLPSPLSPLPSTPLSPLPFPPSLPPSLSLSLPSPPSSLPHTHTHTHTHRIILPLGQSYVLASYFSIWKRILRALIENAIFYITFLIIFAILFVYLVILRKLFAL